MVIGVNENFEETSSTSIRHHVNDVVFLEHPNFDDVFTLAGTHGLFNKSLKSRERTNGVVEIAVWKINSLVRFRKHHLERCSIFKLPTKL